MHAQTRHTGSWLAVHKRKTSRSKSQLKDVGENKTMISQCQIKLSFKQDTLKHLGLSNLQYKCTTQIQLFYKNNVSVILNQRPRLTFHSILSSSDICPRHGFMTPRPNPVP